MLHDFSDFEKKYSPVDLRDVVFRTQDDLNTIQGIVDGSIGFPMSGINSIVLYGTYGTGKSALARIIPNLIERHKTGEIPHSRYFNIAQGGDNGATVISNIMNQASLIPNDAYHYFVLDEIDNLRKEVMGSLKVAINTGGSNSVFVMTTNNLSAIEGGVLDRSILVEFNAAASDRWLPRARQILDEYEISDVTDQELIDIIDLCNGSARKILLSIRQVIDKYSKKVS